MLDQQIINIHNDLLDIMKNTAINRFNAMQFIQNPHNIFSDKINTTISVKYNKTTIFTFIVWSNIFLSDIESIHTDFNFNIRKDDVINTSKFISKIENIVLAIITNHNLIRSMFKIIKPFVSADKLYFDNDIYVNICKNHFELNINDNKIVYKTFDEFKKNDIIMTYKKLSIFSLFC